MANTYIQKDQAGVPIGGTTGQVLTKSSGTDFDYAWGAGGATHLLKRAALIGDSITNQHGQNLSGGLTVVAAQGFWNWANWMSGSPFDFTQNLGFSGGRTEDILAQIWQVSSEIDTVFILTGTNDTTSFSQVATVPQIDAEFTRITTSISSALTILKNLGKNTCIGTIPPNATYTNPADTRITLLDRVNTFILGTEAAGLATKSVDLFTPMWDNTLPTQRVFKTNYSYDGTHLTNAAGQAGGLQAISALKALYSLSKSFSDKHYMSISAMGPLGQFRTIVGIPSTISYGSGTLASGWRTLNNGLGTPTLVLSNATDYAVSTNYVGLYRILPVNGEKWQKLTITNTVLDSAIRMQLVTTIPKNGGIDAGDSYYVEIDAFLESGTNVKEVKLEGICFFTSGTTPVDQAYSTSTSNVRGLVNTSSTGAAAIAYPTQSFRTMLSSVPLRIPENLNKTANIDLQFYVDISFAGVGDAVLSVSRARIMRKAF